MTEREAIERIKYRMEMACKMVGKGEDGKAFEDLEMGIKALDKQIPKKPYHISEIDDNDNAMVECPICHANSDYSINTIKGGYCWKCGQKLDWGNEDAE